MSYDLIASNKELETFHFGAFGFTHLLDQCGSYFACVHHGPKWYCVWGLDPRMPQGDDYPSIISNDGFRVTAEEARVMARIARNYAAIQRTLPEPADKDDWMKPDHLRPWPQKIRTDWVEQYERFAEWADKSGGFKIY